MSETSRVFRVFISSSFRDFKEERNALHRTVFPRLDSLCRQHGYHFQPIDLRWGVRDEAAYDQQTMTICLEELRRCQQVSPRLYFLLLLGDRYGWRPLPTTIPRGDFESFRNVLPSAGRARLNAWYRCDNNTLPEPVYYLLAREGQYRDAAIWGALEADLRADFDAAVEATIPNGDERRVHYCGSATHQEIFHALLGNSPPPNAFCYLRKIEELPPSAGDFLDLAPDGSPDANAKAALRDLKTLLTNRFPETVHHSRVRWADVAKGSVDSSLCKQVETDLNTALLREIEAATGRTRLDGEGPRHQTIAERHRRHFVGRAEPLTVLATHTNSPNGRLLVIRGEPGSGKSALVARASSQPGPPGSVRVVRFLGTTAAASNSQALLESLCLELGLAYGDPRDVPREPSERAADLRRRLGLATAEHPLFVWLDALDQLGDSSLAWLPLPLPAHVCLIVSTPPGPIADQLERRAPDRTLVEIGPLSEDEGARLLDLWLSDVGRTLQPAQRQAILTRFVACPLPLYLKLAFEQARRWKSTTPPESIELRPDVLGLIHYLFDWLAAPARHGPLLIGRELGFLAAARHGLSEDELLRALSADEDYVHTFLTEAHHDLPQLNPQDRRLPVILWSRLYHDLEPYLTEQADAGIPLLTFYHRQLKEVAVRRFLFPAPNGADRHRVLASTFRQQADPTRDATWQGRGSRPLRELPYHLHGLAVSSGDATPLYALLDDDNFRHALFVQTGRPEPLLESLHLALDRATDEADPIPTVRYALARLNLNGFLAARYLRRLDLLAEKNPELARVVADLGSISPAMRLLGLVLVAWIVADRPERILLVEEICTGLGAREDLWFDAAHVSLALGIVRDLALRGVPEAGALLARVPGCPLREVTRRAWEQGPPALRALAVRLAWPVTRTIPPEDIIRTGEIDGLVDRVMQKQIQLQEGLLEELAARFGRDGPVAFAALVAARQLELGERDLARMTMNRSLFEGTGQSPRPLRAFLAVRDRVAGSNPDLAGEFHDRTESGLALMAKLASTSRLHRAQARLTAQHQRQTFIPKVWQSESLQKFAVATQPTNPGDLESVLDTLALALDAILAGDPDLARKALNSVSWSSHPQWPVTDRVSTLIAGYALARVVEVVPLLAVLHEVLKSTGLDPEALFSQTTDEGRAEIMDRLLTGDPVALEAVALALHQDHQTPAVYTLVRDACLRGNEASVDALLGQIIRSPDLADSEIQNVADELTKADRNLGVPTGLGLFYFPFLWALGLWSGLLLLGLGWAGREVILGAIPLALLGGAAFLDLVAWTVIGMWERPERSRRWSAWAGSLAVAAGWGTHLYLNRGEPSEVFRSHIAATSCLLAGAGVAFLAYRLGTRGWLFQPSSLRRQVAGTLLALTGAVLLTIFSNFAVSVLGHDFLAGLWLTGAFLVGIGIHAFVKYIPVRHLCRQKGIRLEETGASLTEREIS